MCLKVNITIPRNGFELKLDATFNNEITGIFGPSGAGKTSLLHCIAGLEDPRQGFIRIGEMEVYNLEKKINLPAHRRNIGIVFQDHRLFPHMTLKENLEFGARFAQKKSVGIDQVAELLDIKNLYDYYPSQLSGGEKQRAAIGRSLLTSPKALLLDEPFSAVDMERRNNIFPFIRKIASEFQIPILIVSHDLSDLLRLTTEIAVLRSGKLIGKGNYISLLKNSVIADLLKSSEIINQFEATPLSPEDSPKGCHDETCTAYRTEGGSFIFGPVFDKTRSRQRKVFLSLHPDDIALSLKSVEQISVQNQMPGTIKEIIKTSNRTMCIIDIGFSVLADITMEAVNTLKLEPGTKVYCLFKARALQINY